MLLVGIAVAAESFERVLYVALETALVYESVVYTGGGGHDGREGDCWVGKRASRAFFRGRREQSCYCEGEKREMKEDFLGIHVNL